MTNYLKPNQTEKVIVQCDANASVKPCWRVVKDAARCPTSVDPKTMETVNPDNFVLEVVRAEAPPPETHMLAYCVTEAK